MGIGLSGKGQGSAFLYDYNAATQQGTGLVLTAGAALNSISASAEFGPVSVSVKKGYAVFNDTGTNASTNPARIVLGVLSPAPGKPQTALPGRHTLGDFQSNPFGDLGIAGAAAHIGVSLPIYFGKTATKPLLTLGLTDDLKDPLNTLVITPGATTIDGAITTALSQVSICQALSGLSAGFDAVFAPALNNIKNSVLVNDLPLIGPGIAGAAGFILGLKQGFDNALQTTSATFDGIKNSILTTFGPGGLNWLQPIPGNTDPANDPDHYLVAQSFLGGPHGAGIQFYVHLRQDVAAAQVPLSADLGFPGLGLNVKGGVYLKLGWDLQLGFGVNTS